MNKALLVIDYTYDFVADDGKLTCGKPGQLIEEALQEQIEKAYLEKVPIFILSDLHEENDLTHPESKLFPPHNIKGTKGRALYGRIKVMADKIQETSPQAITFLDKTRYSSFTFTPLHYLLEHNNIDTLILTGVCTDICVLHTAVDAYNLGYQMIIPKSCVASFNEAGHKWALEHFKNCLGAQVI